jgi:prevent-host-death family protein
MCVDNANETIREARLVYAVTEVRWPDEPLIVERSGRPTAVIISLEEYRRFVAWREERAARRAWVLEHDPRQQMTADQWHAQFAAMDRFAAHFENVSDEELNNELAEAIAAVRAEQSAGGPK